MSLSSPNKKNTQGFTLIEVLVTLLIISFGFLSLSNIQTVLLKSNVFAQQRTEAVMLAQNKLEKLKQTFFISKHQKLQNGSEKIDGKNDQFTLSWKIFAISPNIMRINTQVTWPDNEKNHQVTENSTVNLSSVVSVYQTIDTKQPFTLPDEDD